MPKIIKSVSANALYSDENNKAQKIVNDKNNIFGDYTSLADNEEVYIINGSEKEWIAYRCIAPSVKNKTNFYDMVLGCIPTGEESEVFKTKKALTMEIEMNTVTWKQWEKIPKAFRKTNKVNSPNKDAVSSGGSIPIWVWFIVGIVIVFVIASL